MFDEELNVFTPEHIPKDAATKINRANLPRRARNFSKEQLQKALRKKRECNAKAQRAVETLIEPGRTEDAFLATLKDINQCHMEDIVQERAIEKLCGYALCDNELKNIPKQKYAISLSRSKVFDITERKNFCSSNCYQALKYVKEQMLTSPLWLRDQEDIPNFRLLNGRQLVYRKTDVMKPLPMADVPFGELKIVERTYDADAVKKTLEDEREATGSETNASNKVVGKEIDGLEDSLNNCLSKLNI